MAMRLSLPLEQVKEEAKEVDLKKFFLTLLVFIPFALAWMAGKVWLFLKLVIASMKTGWVEATKSHGGD